MNALALFLPVAARRDFAFTLVIRQANARPRRRRLVCRWRKDPETGGLVCAWSGEDDEAGTALAI